MSNPGNYFYKQLQLEPILVNIGTSVEADKYADQHATSLAQKHWPIWCCLVLFFCFHHSWNVLRLLSHTSQDLQKKHSLILITIHLMASTITVQATDQAEKPKWEKKTVQKKGTDERSLTRSQHSAVRLWLKAERDQIIGHSQQVHYFFYLSSHNSLFLLSNTYKHHYLLWERTAAFTF